MKKIKFKVPVRAFVFIISVVVLIAWVPSALENGSLILYTALFIPVIIISFVDLLFEWDKEREGKEFVNRLKQAR